MVEKLITRYLNISKETATVFIVFDSDIKLKDFELKKGLYIRKVEQDIPVKVMFFFCVINQSLNWLNCAHLDKA